LAIWTDGIMPIPNRTRNKDGTFHKKRSDAGKPRYTRILLEAATPEEIEQVLTDFREAGINYKEVIAKKPDESCGRN
jgi:hypothetical protein